ncbi:MAG: glycosyltransferase family 4 protein [Thermoplasmata archaeon]
MKILHVIPYYLPSRFGGPVTVAHEIAKALRHRGHDVQIFTTNAMAQDDFPSKFKEEEFIDGVIVKRFKVHGKFMSYFFTPKMLASLWREDFDVIHAHGYRNFQTDIVALVSLIKRKPLVINLHGMFAENVALVRGFGKGQRIYDFYDLITQQFSIRIANVLLASSKLEYNSIPKFRDKAQIIPFGVHSKLYLGKKKGFRRVHEMGDEALILYAGRISREKNLETLIKAFGEVSKHYEVKLAMVGGEVPSVQEETEYRKNLISLASDIGVGDDIIFTGWLDDSDLLDAYADADIFVNPSLAENFGLVLLEAGASSLPIVSSRVGIASDLLKDYQWLLFNSETELVSILNELLQNRNLCREIGASLRKRVEKEYTWEKTAERLEEIYETLLH